MGLPFVEFPLEKMKMTTCYKDDSLLDRLRAMRGGSLSLPKVTETYGEITLPVLEDYPYNFASIALSMDGKMAFPETPGGVLIPKSNTLNEVGAAIDFYVLNILRAYGDMVINGTNTLRSEPDFWMTNHDEEMVKERQAVLGKKFPHPHHLIISLDGKDMPWEHHLFHQRKIPISVFTSPAGWDHIEKNGGGNYYFLDYLGLDEGYDGAKIHEGLTTIKDKVPVLVSGEGATTNITTFMRGLKKGGMDQIMIESPTFMWLLMHEKLLHEIFMTHTTVFLGGHLTPGVNSPFTFENHPQSRIAQLNRHGNTFLYSRQILDYEGIK